MQKMKKETKKKIAGWVLLLVVVGAITALFLLNPMAAEEQEEKQIEVRSYSGEETIYTMENENLLFQMDSMTTQFSLTNKKTGTIWYSNPQDADSDALALTSEKAKLKSTLLLTYSTKNGVDTIYNNYTYSIENHLYEIEQQGNDSIKVKYTLGIVQKEFLIPQVITDARMQELMEQMTQGERMKIQDYYKKYDINKLGKKDNKEELLARFPILETEVIWTIRDGTKDHIKQMLEGYFTKVGFTQEEKEAGKLLDTQESTSEKPAFNVSVIYRLEGDSFLAEVPFEEIEYKTNYPVYQLSVLPMFGAGGTGDSGYMIVPEGGGAVIDFNNGKITQSFYYADVYGWDYIQEREAVVHETKTNFNAFSIVRNGEAVLCILEEGAPYASIQADISGKTSSYNYVTAQYSLLHRNQYKVAERTTAAMYVYESELPKEKIVQRYRLVDSEDYSELAAEYGDYLRTRYAGVMTEKEDTEAPVVVELIGAVDKVRQILGVPVSRPLKLTGFQDAATLVSELHQSGFGNLSVKYTGWANGGVEQKMFQKVKPVSALGSKKDLQKMIAGAQDLGVTVYLDGITNYAYRAKLTDGFFSFTDAARAVSKERVQLLPYSTVTYGKAIYEERTPYWLLKASLIQKMAENLSEAVKEYQAGVSFRDYGKDLSSDFNKRAVVTRQTVAKTQQEQLNQFKTSGQRIMINGGNDYAIAYADMVTNMNLTGSDYGILDRFIPFYQMAIHGYLNYTGESLNLAQNMELELLKSAEYGAGLSFTFMNETAFELQSTYYTYYFGAEYEAWRDRAVEIYERYNRELGGTFCQKMLSHRYEAAELTCTTYEDGTKVYVNYSFSEQTAADGTVVPARDYVVSH